MAVRNQVTERIHIQPVGSMCRVELPLLEPSGDAVSVYVEEQDNRLIVHDGGHISGLLFEAGPAGASAADKRTVEAFVKDTGLARDPERGVVFAFAEKASLTYWMFEIGRTIAVASTIVPTIMRPRRVRRRLGPRIAQQIVQRLIAEGLMTFIKPGLTVRGVTEQSRYVDFSYTVPPNPLQQQAETSVFILALDLDVADPIAKAYRGLAAATDLSGAAVNNNAIDVRLVHSVGSANGTAERAIKLIRVAGAKHLLKDYSWDDPSDRNLFLTSVAQELTHQL
jgi:hypothetical protein